MRNSASAASSGGGSRPSATEIRTRSAARSTRRCQPAELLDFLRTHLRPQGLTSWFGGAIGLTDGLIHHQDIRRGLRLPREVPAERVLPAMGFALRSPKLPSRKHVRDVELVATDLDWRHGEGPAVNGTAEALLMTIAGRADALDDLDGPGVGLLRQRLAA